MIVTQCEIHHRSYLNLFSNCYRSILDLMHPKNTALRRVENRCAEQGSINAAVGNGENTAHQVIELQFSFPRFGGEFGYILLELRATFLVTISNNRHHQSTFGANCNTDIIEMILNESIPV